MYDCGGVLLVVDDAISGDVMRVCLKAGMFQNVAVGGDCEGGRRRENNLDFIPVSNLSMARKH